MAKEAKKSSVGSMMTSEDAGIGMLPDGKLNVVNKDDPPWRPKVVDDEGNEVEPEEGE